ncbi:hypothetical protein H072_9081 [Dactylellina haptotyla CBS 200.50]|uniref:Uncharacterized protein n=1 Tax=Dactylellina haptotyla (strain CBS 200.50) TaxID=1284197 RepID=S8BQ06_DACHA|nr:hypothetical protein H072_9081 [Dactylellina haptotyla CBS 200.50]
MFEFLDKKDGHPAAATISLLYLLPASATKLSRLGLANSQDFSGRCVWFHSPPRRSICLRKLTPEIALNYGESTITEIFYPKLD